MSDKPKKSRRRGIKKALEMQGIKKGGKQAKEDNFDRSHPETLANLIDTYKLHLKVLAYSERTVEMHHWTLKNFLTWAEERSLTNPSTINKLHLESYQRYLYRYRKPNGMPLAVGTQKQRLGALQRLFAYLTKHNYILANPASELELPRQPKQHLPKGLNQHELQRLLNVPDTSDPLGVRDRAILETFYATAIRRSELINLDLQDLDPHQQTLHIHKGKGGKSRLLPISKNALHWIDNYLTNVRPLLSNNLNDAEPEQALFISGYGERLSSKYLGNWMKKTLLQANIKRPGSCHLLRHTCATHMLENGADIRHIQQLLGHASLETTSIYTQVAIGQLQAIYNQTHPSALQKK